MKCVFLKTKLLAQQINSSLIVYAYNKDQGGMFMNKNINLKNHIECDKILYSELRTGEKKSFENTNNEDISKMNHEDGNNVPADSTFLEVNVTQNTLKKNLSKKNIPKIT